MKTIFITISRGFIARNILQTEVSSRLLAAGHRLVIATPAYADPDFIKEFSRPSVTFVPLEVPPWTVLDRLLVGLHRNLLWNRTVLFTAKYGIYDPHQATRSRYLLHITVFRILSLIPFLRDVVRFLDARLRPPPLAVTRQLRAAAPDVVFITNPMEHGDSFYIKAAQRLGIVTAGLVKSWDNMSKTSFRALTDYALVWAPYMTDEAVRYQRYARAHVIEVGVPQFDVYVKKEGLRTRDEFLRSVGLDPARATILYGSSGKVTPVDPEIVRIIAEMIRRGDLIRPAQIFVRPHFGYKGDADKFDAVADLPHVAVDRTHTPRPIFYDQWDYSRPHFLRLAESLAAVDVVATVGSTLGIDAAAAGRPAINIAFDGSRRLPLRFSIARWYETEYHHQMKQTGAVPLAWNPAELRALLNARLAEPDRNMPERAELIKRFVGVCDGGAGRRVADFLTNL